MSDESYIQSLFSDRVGGSQFGKDTKIYKFEKIKKLRSNNLPTIPSSLEDELKSNIFLRCDQNDLKIILNMKNEDDFKVFRKVRDLKDSF